VIEGGAKFLTGFHQDSVNGVDNIARLERNVHLRVDGARSDEDARTDPQRRKLLHKYRIDVDHRHT